MYRARHDAADAGDQTRVVAHSNDTGGGAHDVYNIARARAGPDSVPMRVEGSDRNGNASAKPKFVGPLRPKMSGYFVARVVAPVQFRANTRQQRIDRYQKIFRRQPAERRVPHPLVTHGANRALHFCGIADSAKNCGGHVAMLESCREARSFFRIVAQPMQQLRKAPFGRITSATPIDRFEFLAAGGFSNERGFTPR